MMSLSFRRLYSLFAMVLVLLLLTPTPPSATLAQAPPPTPVDEQAATRLTLDAAELSVPTVASPPRQIGERYTPPSDALPEMDVVVPFAEAEPVAPAGYMPPSELADLSLQQLNDLSFPQQIQGDIQVDVVISPERVTPGQDIIYTYIFTNTRSTPASDFVIAARWTEFAFVNNRNTVQQFCKNSDLQVVPPRYCLPEQQRNATVEIIPHTTDANVIYQITSSLAPGQSGSFQVVLGTRDNHYPLTGQPPKRPAGSAALANSVGSPSISEDTANAIFIGPVFVLEKDRTSPATHYYARPDQVVEFTIRLGNATAPGDRAGDLIRADAVAATNITLTDRIPAGSQYVSSEGPVQAEVDEENGEIRWVIPGPLQPGANPLEFKVRFFKLDVAIECTILRNNTYFVTSDEIPLLGSATTRHIISGRRVDASIQVPVVIAAVSADPARPILGNEAEITIRVQNFWDRPINDLELRYIIQSNAYYIPGRANPPPYSAPDGRELGGDVVWKLNMPAGSFSAPSSQTVTLVIRGGNTTTVARGTGVASVSVPQDVPSACIQPRSGRANFQAFTRLFASKLADPEMEQTEGQYLVTRGGSFTYIIEIENRSSETADNVRVIDRMPSGNGANFSYQQGSSTLNGQSFQPTDVRNGSGGTITWEGISVPAEETIQLRYTLNIEGYEYIDHCNAFDYEVVDSDETVNKTRANRVCVRISPPMILTKTASRETIDGNNEEDNHEVVFTLTYRNLDNREYRVGLYDVGGNFAFVRMDDDNPPPTVVSGNTFEWPQRTIGPNESYTVRFVARLDPPRCRSTSFNNILDFRFTPSLGGTSYVVRSVPRTAAPVEYLCGTVLNTLTFSKAIDPRGNISLQDRHEVRLNVKNNNTEAEQRNVRFIDVLPPGFTFDGMSPDSAIRDQPQSTTREDGRVVLTWTLATLAPDASTNVRFFARSGDIVGPFRNLFRAEADNIDGVGTCPDDPQEPCRNYEWIEDEDDEFRLYAFANIQVVPMATVEPTIERADQCVNLDHEQERDYQISIVNTNRHAYTSTAVTVTLPLGLYYERMLEEGGNPPRVISEDHNGTVLRWENLYVPEKPADVSAAQIALRMRLRIGEVWGPLQPRAQANSPDGALPIKDGVLDPIISLCEPPNPALGLHANKSSVSSEEEFYYVISAINPTNSPVNVDIRNNLNEKLQYLQTLIGPSPQVDGQNLIWSNLTIPAATDERSGRLLIVFRVQVNGGVAGDVILNWITHHNTEASFNTDRSFTQVFVIEGVVIRKLYLPLVVR
ncbi:DUF11 domain-containing protein [Candidatus Viridilinea mediisalina]|nr:DUF11 domain-containing protein [Candidatus Viridilinea mediisalina]